MSSKLVALRRLMVNGDLNQGVAISAYLLPRTDAHGSEYICERDERVKWLSGFSGSNATTIITKNKALLWTDGRYFLQAEKEFENGWELMKEGTPQTITPINWLIANLEKTSVIGFDPELVDFSTLQKYKDMMKANEIQFLPISTNLVDAIWQDRPTEKISNVIVLDEKNCGRSSADKIEELRGQMKDKKCDSIILGSLDDVCWLFNIRGQDIAFNPVVFSIAFVTLESVFLFINRSKLTKELEGVTILDYSEAKKVISEFHKDQKNLEHHKMWIPPKTNSGLSMLIADNSIYSAESPVFVTKSVKNETELSGMRSSHIRDSAAVIQFLFQMENELKAGKVWTEDSAANLIDKLRTQKDKYVSNSFGTISAVNANAAMPHYSHDPKIEPFQIKEGDVYLCDSGAQYLDGTTDVTRTVVVGDKINEDFRNMFTHVLIGHIECAYAKFPEGITGLRIDAFARQSLWAAGFDFGHGTGHGVGHFLNVHEGPCSIAYRYSNENGGIKPGMVITIEPGYYRAGHWGIRIENCYEIIRAKVQSGADNFVTFKALTLVPIQKTLINKEMLSEKQIKWVDDYHQEVYQTLSKHLIDNNLCDEAHWLKSACEPL
uniref:Xaa-Pro aminopeptidase 1 n=1 Tax=Rhabditophanes sp. KR3021 TaxID=114890 RepID=A0AC35TQA4_9BILA